MEETKIDQTGSNEKRVNSEQISEASEQLKGEVEVNVASQDEENSQNVVSKLVKAQKDVGNGSENAVGNSIPGTDALGKEENAGKDDLGNACNNGPDNSVNYEPMNAGNGELENAGNGELGNAGNGELGNAGYGELGNAGNGELGNAGYGELGNAGNGELGNAGYGELGNAGNCEVGNAGNGELENAGNGELGNAGYGKLGNAGNGEVGNAGNGELENAGYGELGNAGNCEVGNAGNGELENAGNGELGNAGYGKLGNAGNGEVGNAGNGELENAGNGELENAGNGEVGNAGNGEVGNAGNSELRNAGNGELENAGNGEVRDAGNGEPGNAEPENAGNDVQIVPVIDSNDVSANSEHLTRNNGNDVLKNSECVSGNVAMETGNNSNGTCSQLVHIKLERTDNGTEMELSECPGTTLENGKATDAEMSMEYRIKEEYVSTSDSDSDDDSSSSEENDKEGEASVIEEEEEEHNGKAGQKKNNKYFLDDIKTKGELYPEDLPPLEELKITVDENTKLVPMGKISSIVGVLVIVKANKDVPPMNEDTILFLEGRVVFGQVFEVFGPVSDPWYSIRFNSPADIVDKGIAIGMEVFCAPLVEDFTKYVFVNQLQQIKGSDASWEDNNEPPKKFLDFSDDEEERETKNKMRAKNRGQSEGQNEQDQLPGAKRRRNRNNREDRRQQQGNWQNNSGQNFNSRNFQHGSNRFQQHVGPQNFNQRNGSVGHPRPFRNTGPRHEHYRPRGPFGAPPNFPAGPGGQNFNRPQANRMPFNYVDSTGQDPAYNQNRHTNYRGAHIRQPISQNGFYDYSQPNQLQPCQPAGGAMPPAHNSDRQYSSVWHHTATPQPGPVGPGIAPAVMDHRFVQNTNADGFSVSPPPPTPFSNTANFPQNPSYYMSSSTPSVPPPMIPSHTTIATLAPPSVIHPDKTNPHNSGYLQVSHAPLPPQQTYPPAANAPPPWCPPDFRRPPPAEFGGHPRFQSGPPLGQ